MTQKDIKSNYVIKREHPDYEAFRKSIFKLKLDGTHDTILRMVYMMGYVEGHEFGKLMGNLIADDLEKAYVEFADWLDNQCKGEKPT